ncbi:MAG: FAD-linked oxidase C-terminal domain-containing protein [Acidobacteriota bacterium]
MATSPSSASPARAGGPFAAVTPEHRRALVEHLGPDAVRWDDDARERYGRDETEDLWLPPDLVVLPRSRDDVMRVMALAHRARLPVTPRGAGTGLSGGALPARGGIALALERLDRIRDIDLRNLTVEAETGVRLGALQAAVAAHGLAYPPDPGSRDTCQLGGTLAENSAGPRSCKYGTTRQWVLGLEAVLADGTPIDLGGGNRKDVAGYDLTQLLIGSEGTLAVLTAAVLRLIPRPRAAITLLLPFPALDVAAAAVEMLFRRGCDPSACELLDDASIACVRDWTDLPPALDGHRALLLVELDGDDPDALLTRATQVDALAQALGGGETIAAVDAADQRRLWRIRSLVGKAVKARSVYKEADAVVPRPRLADLVRSARRVAEAHDLQAVCYGHAGDGNLHVNLLRGDLDDAQWSQRRDAAEAALFADVLALGGSITGEHGVGLTQRRFLADRIGGDGLDLMRAIKRAFDPRGILNPDKIFPDAAADENP